MRFNKNELHSKGYHLVAADLRKLSEVESKFQECQLEKSLPTLFLFECVLVYMPIASSSGLLKLIASLFPTSYCISYEQVCLTIISFFDRINWIFFTRSTCPTVSVMSCWTTFTREAVYFPAWKPAFRWNRKKTGNCWFRYLMYPIVSLIWSD